MDQSMAFYTSGYDYYTHECCAAKLYLQTHKVFHADIPCTILSVSAASYQTFFWQAYKPGLRFL